MKRVYISGPMRGFPFFNKQRFMDVDAYLRSHRISHVYNPIVLDEDELGLVFEDHPEGDESRLEGFDFYEAMRRDLRSVTKADSVVCLPGWSSSSGARHELRAAIACGLDIYEVEYADSGTISGLRSINADELRQVVFAGE